jgi:hypothetical protein
MGDEARYVCCGEPGGEMNGCAFPATAWVLAPVLTESGWVLAFLTTCEWHHGDVIRWLGSHELSDLDVSTGPVETADEVLEVAQADGAVWILQAA